MSPRTPEERFWAKVEKTDDCWLWTASKNSKGYALFTAGQGKVVLAHRWAYELLIGPIPEDRPQLDHLCRVRHCVNPAHLEPVTNRQNALRGESPWAANAAKTHCPQGHPYDEANTYVTGRGQRMCRACRNAAARRKYQARKREALLGVAS